tara:strand:- start:1468 stop:1701 length:234 start_codon:yes stop_codon:yes gene_type:complete
MKHKTKFLVFDVNNGPKTVVDSLNVEGEAGWQLASIIAVGDGNHLVAFLTKSWEDKIVNPEEDQKKNISKLWGGSGD